MGVLDALALAAAADGRRFLEVGGWLGDSTVIPGRRTRERGGKLFCVDRWRGTVDTPLGVIAVRNDVHAIFRRRIVAEGLEETVVPIRADSNTGLEVLASGRFDLVFIDGDHRYEQARRVEQGAV